MFPLWDIYRIPQSKVFVKFLDVIHLNFCWSTKPLIHQEARFWLINKGEATAIIHGKTVKLTAGTLVAVLPFEITQIVHVESPLQYYIVVYHFDSVNILIKTLYNESNESLKFMEDIKTTPWVECDKQQYQKVKTIFTDLKEELGTEGILQTVDPGKLSSVYVTNHLVALILEFFRMQQPVIKNNDRDDSKFSKEDILQYIYAHLSEDITAKYLSKIFYMNESTISQYVKHLTGLSVVELCHEMRIVKVSNYLLYTDLTISELSEIVGYSDASHLSKLFKARMGVKINEYRKTYQQVSELCKIREDKNVYSIVSYIYKNHTEDLTIKKVAETFGMSALMVNRVLLYQVEKNFGDFLNYIRINHSCKLLLTTDKSNIDIAIEVGYSNAKTFTRNFLKYKVMMPSDFRRKVWLQTLSVGDSLFPLE